MPEFMDVHTAWDDPETGMVFCLCEAPSADAVQRIHERAGHPADKIYEVPGQAWSDGEQRALRLGLPRPTWRLSFVATR